jgi:tetratricopeptide (TPR) repeat protein
LFYEIRQRLWVKREEPVDTLTEEITDTAPKLQGELAGFKQDLDNEKHLPDATRSDVLADYYNDQGLLYEFMAWTASDVKNKIVLANKAVGAFKEALQWKLNWIPAKSNLARVYMDLLQDYDLAIRCWQDVELVRPGDDYAEYMLGRLYEKKGDSASAEIHYKKRSPYCKR